MCGRERAGTRPARPEICTWAICVRRCWPGSSPARRGGDSCCGSRIWIRAGCVPAWPSGRSRTSPSSDSRSTGIRSGSHSGTTRTRPRSSRWPVRRTSASAPGGRSPRRPRPRTVRCLAIPVRAGISPRTSAPSAGRADRPLSECGPRRLRQTVHDLLHGPVSGVVDDFVVRRGDGGFAYNLAVVVDDTAMGVDQVVRGDDLLPSAINQAWLAERLGAEPPTYAHVPLARQRGGSAAGQAGRAGHPGRPRRPRAQPWRGARPARHVAGSGRAGRAGGAGRPAGPVRSGPAAACALGGGPLRYC